MAHINIEKFDSHAFDSITKEGCPYTQASSKVIQHIHNKEALALWMYFQSLPPEWNINKYQVMKCFDIGEVVYKRTMSFLRKCKLIDYINYKSETGAFYKTRVLVKNGSEFIHQCTEKTCCKSYESKESTTSTESVPLEETINLCNAQPLVQNVYVRDVYVRQTPPLIKKQIIKKQNIKTTTTPIPPIIENRRTEEKDSSSSICIHELEEYGFKELHSRQLHNVSNSIETINLSISNYKEALKDHLFSYKIKNKVSYFMGIMRSAGIFEGVGKRILTPIEQKVRYQIENNVDNRYGI